MIVQNLDNRLSWPPRPLALSGAPRRGLGQWNQWGVPIGGTTGTGGTGTIDLRCYRCGLNPPRHMQPAAAAFNPSCVEVDMSLCPDISVAPPETPFGTIADPEPSPWGVAPGGGITPLPSTSPFDGPTQVTLTVQNPVDQSRIAGAQVSVALYTLATSSAGAPVITGVTDTAGQFYFERMAPPTNTLYRWRITVSPGPGSPSFESRVMDVPARTPTTSNRATGEAERFFPLMNVCIAGTDPLVCDVADAQLQFQMVYAQQLAALNYETTGRPPQVAGHAADLAHASIRFRTARLNAGWDTYSWWVGDKEIPPGDWPALLDRVGQVAKIFGAIPFPAIDNYFMRCARGIPLYNRMSINNPRFYTDTFNAEYWPRDDWRIEVDMAAVYWMNLGAIYECVKHKIRKKIREIERSAKAWRNMSLATTFMLAPLAGAAAPTLLATETSTYIYESLTGEPVTGEAQAIVTAGVSVIAADPAAIEALVKAAIEALLSDQIEGLDPIVQQIVMGAAPKLASAAVQDIASGILGTGGVTGASDFTSLQAAGSAAAAAAIVIIADIIQAQGIKSVEGLQDTLFAFQNMDALLIPFAIWWANTLLMGALFEAAARLAGQQQAAAGIISDGTPLTDFDTNRDLVQPLVDDAEAAGVEIPPGLLEERIPLSQREGASTGDLVALAGIGAGGLFVALLVTGALGT